jgi:hypothetical protein
VYYCRIVRKIVPSFNQQSVILPLNSCPVCNTRASKRKMSVSVTSESRKGLPPSFSKNCWD